MRELTSQNVLTPQSVYSLQRISNLSLRIETTVKYKSIETSKNVDCTNCTYIGNSIWIMKQFMFESNELSAILRLKFSLNCLNILYFLQLNGCKFPDPWQLIFWSSSFRTSPISLRPSKKKSWLASFLPKFYGRVGFSTLWHTRRNCIQGSILTVVPDNQVFLRATTNHVWVVRWTTIKLPSGLMINQNHDIIVYISSPDNPIFWPKFSVIFATYLTRFAFHWKLDFHIAI